MTLEHWSLRMALLYGSRLWRQHVEGYNAKMYHFGHNGVLLRIYTGKSCAARNTTLACRVLTEIQLWHFRDDSSCNRIEC